MPVFLFSRDSEPNRQVNEKVRVKKKWIIFIKVCLKPQSLQWKYTHHQNEAQSSIIVLRYLEWSPISTAWSLMTIGDFYCHLFCSGHIKGKKRWLRQDYEPARSYSGERTESSANLQMSTRQGMHWPSHTATLQSKMSSANMSLRD